MPVGGVRVWPGPAWPLCPLLLQPLLVFRLPLLSEESVPEGRIVQLCSVLGESWATWST